ncbi:MAG: 50S ribosomal protein L11 methyltransferase [Rhodospirillales bacterium]
MKADGKLELPWRIEAAVSVDTVQAFEAVLEPFCEAISWFVTETGNGWHIEGFCQQKPDPDALAKVVSEAAGGLGVAAPNVLINRVKPRDWLADNLLMFPPIEAGRYFIHSTHYNDPVPPGRTGLTLNPGMAFGSGEHATTRGCLMAFDWLADDRRFGRVLDMGAGSGILAIAAARTWGAKVIAADSDPKAVMVSAQNASLNGISDLVRAVESDGYGAGEIVKGRPFDLIASNILANPLISMAGDLSASLAGGGVAVLAGFYQRDGEDVLAAHRSHGLKPIKRIDIEDWRTLVLEGPDTS